LKLPLCVVCTAIVRLSEDFLYEHLDPSKYDKDCTL